MIAKTVADLVTELQQVVARQQAAGLARAIASTLDRHRDGFMAHGTMKHHVASLWGTADARGLRAAVEQELAGRARRCTQSTERPETT